MIARSSRFGVILSATFIALSAAPAAYAQCGGGGPAGVYGRAPASHRDIDGVVYYFDQRGQPVYRDDYAHYNYQRRFLYQNGGWVLLSRGRGYYGHIYGIHHGDYSSGHAGAYYFGPQAGYSAGHGRGYSGRHAASSGGHHAGHGSGHGHY